MTRDIAPDILVIGAGVFGLSVAYAAHRAGLRVRVLEADRPGAGASGGVVGALTPHAPTRWRPMMAFQHAALVSLADRAAELHAATGLELGYRRCGRLVPIPDDAALGRARADVAAAPEVWPAGRMEILPAEAAPMLAPGLAALGVLHDDLSARISPRRYLAALVAALPAGTVDRALALTIHPDGAVKTDGGIRRAGAVVCAAGWPGRSLLPAGLQGGGVKGQAALVRHTGDMPIITHAGLYVVPHGDGTVAIGSTSEKTWTDPAPDTGLDDLLARAGQAIPALAGAEVIERWAGIRPKPPGREPFAGPVPGRSGLWVATGGYRIGLGIAHAIGDALVAMITGGAPPIPLPPTFRPGADSAVSA